jgi:hypothetical protein
VLDAQETRKVIPPDYHDFLPLMLEEGLRQLPPKCPEIFNKSISNHTVNQHMDAYMDCHEQNSRLKRNGETITSKND